MTQEEFGALTLTQCLEIAIVDIRKVINDPEVAADSSEWLQQDVSENCAVCDAGAVMLYTLDGKQKLKVIAERLGVLDDDEAIEVTPLDFNSSAMHRLDALNCLRTGSIYAAFAEVNKNMEDSIIKKLFDDYGIPNDLDDDFLNCFYNTKDEMQEHVRFLEDVLLPIVRNADEVLAKAGIKY